MNVRYRVTLSPDERGELRALVSGGKGAARMLKRAQILLAADAGIGAEDIALNVVVGTSTASCPKTRSARIMSDCSALASQESASQSRAIVRL